MQADKEKAVIRAARKLASTEVELEEKKVALANKTQELKQAIEDAEAFRDEKEAELKVIYRRAFVIFAGTYPEAETQLRSFKRSYEYGQNEIAKHQAAIDSAELELKQFDTRLASLESALNDFNQLAAGNSGLSLDSLSSELHSYNFCTDGNVTLNTNCNRFDEGTTLSEIADFWIQSYTDSFETQAKRDGRVNFYESDVFNYVVRRYRALSDMRDLIEDVDRYTELFGVDATLVYDAQCKGADVPSYCNFIAPSIEGAVKVSRFMMDLVLMPDHMCELKGTNAEGDVVYSLHSLASLFDDLKFSDLPEGTPVPDSCFDSAITDILENNNRFTRHISLETFPDKWREQSS